MTWAPFNGIYFSVYEYCKSESAKYSGYSGIIQNVLCTIVAGTVASTLTSPIDLVKTRLQVQLSNPSVFDYKVIHRSLTYKHSFLIFTEHALIQGPVDAAMKIIAREGAIALFDGLGARIIWLTPRLSIAVNTYEHIKKLYSR